MSTFNFLGALFFSFMFIKLVDYADSQPTGKLPVPVYFILDEFPNIGQIPDFEKKISTVRSRDISLSVIFQNLAQMQNRYPHGVWEEIIGGCDTQLFLGCNDQTTAEYISKRTGEISTSVETWRKSQKSLPVQTFTPEIAVTKADGKRRLLTMDEVLRLERNKMLLIVTGSNIMKLDKYDFSEHPLSKETMLTVHTEHVPIWRQQEEIREMQNQINEIERQKKIQKAKEAEELRKQVKAESGSESAHGETQRSIISEKNANKNNVGQELGILMGNAELTHEKKNQKKKRKPNGTFTKNGKVNSNYDNVFGIESNEHQLDMFSMETVEAMNPYEDSQILEPDEDIINSFPENNYPGYDEYDEYGRRSEEKEEDDEVDMDDDPY